MSAAWESLTAHSARLRVESVELVVWARADELESGVWRWLVEMRCWHRGSPRLTGAEPSQRAAQLAAVQAARAVLEADLAALGVAS